MKRSKRWVFFGLAGVLFALTVYLSANSLYADGGEGTIVVANRASGDVTLIDVATDTASTLAMPAGANTPEPMYVVHKDGRVFVGDRANDRIAVFDSSDWSVVGAVPAGSGVFHMWAQPGGSQLWVNNDVDNTITVINTNDLAVITTIALPADLVALGGKPHDVILNKKSAYVTMLGLAGPNDAVIRYDLMTFQEKARANVGQDPHVTIDPQNGRLYVAAQNSSEVQVLRRNDLSLVTMVSIPGAHGIDIRADGSIVYVTNISGGGIDAIFALDTQSNTVVGTPVDTPFAVPHNLVLTGANDKLYVTHSGGTADQVSVFTVSAQNPEPVFLTSVTAGLNPFGIEFVP